MKRNDGFYWVKFQGELQIAQWCYQNTWMLTGSEINYYDGQLDYINEKQIIYESDN